MNFTLCKTRRLPGGRRPVHLRTLPELLNDMGVPGLQKRSGDRSVQFRHKRGINNLWDKYDAARALWRSRIRSARHDFVENHQEAAEINAIWTTIKRRFDALGIGCMLMVACSCSALKQMAPNQWNITVPTGNVGKPFVQGVWLGIGGALPWGKQ